MAKKGIGIVLIILGAILCYGAKLICRKILHMPNPDDKVLVYVKLVGLAVVLLGIVLLFIIGGVRI